MFKLFLLIFLTFPSISGALTCLKDYAGTASCLENENTAGDCITLGYSTDNVEGCSNYLYCPFNTAYKKCVAGNTSSGGNSEDDSCRIGYVLYSDGSCSSIAGYNSSKTPIGVIYALSDTLGSAIYKDMGTNKNHRKSYHGRAIALRDLTYDSNYKFNPNNPHGNSTKGVPYGLYGFSLSSVPSYTTDTEKSGWQYAYSNSPSSFFDGKTPTKILATKWDSGFQSQIDKYECKYENPDGIIQGKDANSNTYCFAPAAKGAYYYYPTGVDRTDSFAGQYQWYLPSLGELIMLFGIDYTQVGAPTSNGGVTLETVSKVNSTLRDLKLLGHDVDIIYYYIGDDVSGDGSGDYHSTGKNPSEQCSYHSSSRAESSEYSWMIFSGARSWDKTTENGMGVNGPYCVRPSIMF